MSADNPQVFVGAAASGVYYGVLGRATQRVVPTLARLSEDFLASKPAAPAICIDLNGATWIDSTFAGWLVGLQKRIGNGLQLANCSERCRTSLERLQLNGRFALTELAPPAELRPVNCATSDRPDRAALELMLAAHEALAGVDAQNQRIFGPIVQVLRSQLQAKA